ncbi:MAG: polymorphic toxin type 50 domain-containing protein [Parachlamydia sp.]|nr:polymorphic toxin type 50 domain-containing protein [Parachlamydia sp.]
MKQFDFCYYLLILFLFNVTFVSAHPDDTDAFGYGNGMTGCGCLIHCKCFSIISEGYPGGFPSDTNRHPYYTCDKLWHTFMKGMITSNRDGPYSNLNSQSFHNIIGNPALLSEYIDILDSFYLHIEWTRVDNIKFYADVVYKAPRDKGKLDDQIARICSQAIIANHILDETLDRIIPLYKQILEECHHNEDYNMVIPYCKGLLSLMEGNSIEAAIQIDKLIELAEKNGKSRILQSKLFQDRCEIFLDHGMYHDAIETASKAIAKNPKNKEIYLLRAVAYFETGNFNEALTDYQSSGKQEKIAKIKIQTSSEFRDALFKGLIKGSAEAITDFVPSLLGTLNGIKCSLWACVEHPINTSANFVNACYEMGKTTYKYAKQFNIEQIEDCVDEVKLLCSKYDNLSDSEKGDLIGLAIGKYGVDIFAGTAVLKNGVKYKKLLEANRICNLEALANEITKAKIIETGTEFRKAKERFYSTLKIHWDSQNKHIVGSHNFEPDKSIFEHPEPLLLLKKFAGRGRSISNSVPGQNGYQEIVDFGEFIGMWRDKEKKMTLPTTRGKIHYSKNGAHIVPSEPHKNWIK